MPSRLSFAFILLLAVLLLAPMLTSAAPSTQILQATATPIPTASPGHGQGMAILKAEADKAMVQPGEEVRFTLQIKSTGTRDLNGVNVVYDAPAGLELLTATATRSLFIDLWENHLKVEVGDLPPKEVVEILMVARVPADIPEGTALVSHFRVSSAYAGSQEAIAGFTVGNKGSSLALPQTGRGIALVLVGVVLAIGIILLHGLRSHHTSA